jgi:hypothetical protein
MRLSEGWTEYHVLDPEIRHKSRTRRQVQHWLREHKLVKCKDWVYAGYRSVDGQGKRHIFRIKDRDYVMLAKLTFG